MTKNNRFLLGTALALGMALASAGASAQGFYDDSYVNDRGETVIVHPTFDRLQRQQLVGRVNGEVDPVRLSISREVSYSDLDLSRDSDFSIMRDRIADTAKDLCRELDARDNNAMTGWDLDADRECVRTATADAMSQLPIG